MTDNLAVSSVEGSESPPHAGGRILIRRVRFLCAMAVAAAIFWYVGWQVVAPIDSDGPVTMLLVDHGVVAMAELLGLAVVVSGLAVAFGGAGSADRGPLAIAVGLATLGLRGSQLDALVLYRLNPSGAGQTVVAPFPTWELIAECWLWLALIAVGFVVGRWVESWHAPVGDKPLPESHPPIDHVPDLRQGLGTIAVSSLVAWGVLSFTIGGEAHPCMKGQIYFAVGLSFLLGSLIAHGVFRVRSRAWALLSVAVVACAAYVFGSPAPNEVAGAMQTGTYLTLGAVARPLPVEYAALGAIGVLLESDAMTILRTLFGLRGAESTQGGALDGKA